MLSDINQVDCPHDGVPRNPNLSIPCDTCGSRNFLIFGYRYPHEISQIKTMIWIIAGFVILAIIGGALYFIWMASGLSATF
jgi:hypothetical protein